LGGPLGLPFGAVAGSNQAPRGLGFKSVQSSLRSIGWLTAQPAGAIDYISSAATNSVFSSRGSNMHFRHQPGSRFLTGFPLILGFAVFWCGSFARVAAGQDDSPCGPSSRNGPLARLIPQDYQGADFRPACRSHDACYGCPGADKESCDRQFLEDLICACQNSAHPRRCEAWARRMYLATRVAGRKSFLRGQQ